MNKRRAILVLLVFAVVITFLFVWFSFSSEPRYQGKRLTEWWDKTDATGAPLAAERETTSRQFTNLVVAVGPRALPFYVACLDYRPSPNWSENLASWLEAKTSGRIRLPLRKNRIWEAYRSIEVLGPAAAPIIPDLAKLAVESYHPAFPAASLGNIGPAALSALSNIVATATDPVICTGGLLALGTLGLAARPATPLLRELITRDGSEEEIRLANLALCVLAECETNQVERLLLLTTQLAGTKNIFGACYGLMRIESPGMPLLLQALTNTAPDVRRAATAALAIGFDEQALRSPKFSDFYASLMSRQINPPAKGDLERRMCVVLMHYRYQASAECRLAASNTLAYLRVHDAQAVAEIPESSP